MIHPDSSGLSEENEVLDFRLLPPNLYLRSLPTIQVLDHWAKDQWEEEDEELEEKKRELKSLSFERLAVPRRVEGIETRKEERQSNCSNRPKYKLGQAHYSLVLACARSSAWLV